MNYQSIPVCFQVVLAVEGGTGRVLHHQRASEKRLRFPLEIFEDPSEVRLHFDLVDPGISICTQAVPPLFQARTFFS